MDSEQRARYVITDSLLVGLQTDVDRNASKYRSKATCATRERESVRLKFTVVQRLIVTCKVTEWILNAPRVMLPALLCESTQVYFRF